MKKYRNQKEITELKSRIQELEEDVYEVCDQCGEEITDFDKAVPPDEYVYYSEYWCSEDCYKKYARGPKARGAIFDETEYC